MRAAAVAASAAVASPHQQAAAVARAPFTSSAAPAAASATSSSVAHSPAPPSLLPISRANLELLRESLASGDHERVTRALHYLGRQVDLAPAPASSGVAVTAGGVMALLPTSVGPVPAPHATDAAYLSVLERTVAGVLAATEAAASLRWQAHQQHSAAAASATGPPPVDAVLLSTALSVLRKLFRNAAPYMLPSVGAAVATLIACAQHAGKDALPLLDRTLDEVCERMPADVGLLHLVAAVTTYAGPASGAGDGSLAAPESSATSTEGASSWLVASAPLCSAAFRALARLVPRVPAQLLVNECAGGRIMRACQAGFAHPVTEARRAVVTLLVALSLALRGLFTRYVDAYLTVPQSKLLAVYVEKALLQASVAR